MEFRILGPLEVYSRGRVVPLGGRKQRTLLAFLVVHSPRPGRAGVVGGAARAGLLIIGTFGWSAVGQTNRRDG